MEAFLWMHNKKCRVLLKEDGVVVEKDDSWNNRASAECMVLDLDPEVAINFVKTPLEITKLNEEWEAVEIKA